MAGFRVGEVQVEQFAHGRGLASGLLVLSRIAALGDLAKDSDGLRPRHVSRPRRSKAPYCQPPLSAFGVAVHEDEADRRAGSPPGAETCDARVPNFTVRRERLKVTQPDPLACSFGHSRHPHLAANTWLTDSVKQGQAFANVRKYEILSKSARSGGLWSGKASVIRLKAFRGSYLAKVGVEGSNPFARSNKFNRLVKTTRAGPATGKQ